VNVARTVHAFETVGIAGIHLEDQVTPKKCGAMAGKQIISMQEMSAKIKVARESLDDKEFIIIGRCDGKYLGKDEVKRRLYAYLEAGSDLIMLGDDYEVEDLRDFGAEFFGKLYLVTGVFSTVPMCLPVSEYAAMGYKAVAYPVVGFLAAAKAINDVYESIRDSKGLSPEEHARRCMPNSRVNELLEINKWLSLERFME
jgi:2-methylisocitrate lyase-like PEP mutase family enzyme